MDRINLGPAKPKKWWVGENSPQEGAATPVTLDPGPWASRLVFLGCLGWILVTPVSCSSCLLGIPSCLHFIRTFTTLVKNNYLNSFFLLNGGQGLCLTCPLLSPRASLSIWRMNKHMYVRMHASPSPPPHPEQLSCNMAL